MPKHHHIPDHQCGCRHVLPDQKRGSRSSSLERERKGPKKKKSRRRCTCRFWCRKKKRPPSTSPEERSRGRQSYTNKSERYEYVVEKLGIRAVPLSSFATEEDMVECQTASSTSFMKGEGQCQQARCRKSAVTFASYFANTSPTPMVVEQPKQIVEVQNEENCEKDDEDKNKNFRALLAQNSDMSEQEKDMVTNILQNFTALYTSDPEKLFLKEMSSSKQQQPQQPKVIGQKMLRKTFAPPQTIINKDNNLTKNTRTDSVVPTFRKQVQAQVHKTIPTYPVGNSAAQPHMHTSASITREMQANLQNNQYKHHHPHSNCERYNKEDDDFSKELRCIALDKDCKLILHKCLCDGEKEFHSEKVSIEPPALASPLHSTNQKSSRSPVSTLQVPKELIREAQIHKVYPTHMNNRLKHHGDVLERKEEKDLIRVLEEEDKVAVLPSSFSIREIGTLTEEESLGLLGGGEGCRSLDVSSYTDTGDEPIMEINHVKGHNLKWKIIIKHHDDDDTT